MIIHKPTNTVVEFDRRNGNPVIDRAPMTPLFCIKTLDGSEVFENVAAKPPYRLMADWAEVTADELAWVDELAILVDECVEVAG